jgi:hypothetical protein
MAHRVKITSAFEFPVLTLTVPGLRVENIKILGASNQPWLLLQCFAFFISN